MPLAVYGSNDYVDDSETFTQEFRLTSSGSGPFQWVGGLYYMNEETYRDETVPAGLLAPDGDGGAFVLVPAVDAGDKQDNTTDSYAIFGQVTWDITDKLAITAGGRQTWEEKKISRLGTPNGLAPARIFDFSTSEDWSAFTAKGGIEFQATDDLFFYATVSEGFKSGGYQGTAATELAAITPFEPEEAVLYEVGAKTEWFDNRLRLNLAVFHTDYKDLQILQLLEPEGSPIGTPGQLVTQNAADAEIRGAELEFTLVPLEGLTLSGSYTYLDTEFSNFFIPDGFRPPGGVDPADSSREGNDLRNAPEHAFNILARYEMFLDGGASLAFQADYRYKDKVYQDPDLLEEASVPSYDVMDLSTSYTFPSGNIELTGWIRNL